MKKLLPIVAVLGLLAPLSGCGEESKPADQLAAEIQKQNQPNAPQVPQELKDRGMMRGGKGGTPPGIPAEQAPRGKPANQAGQSAPQ